MKKKIVLANACNVLLHSQHCVEETRSPHSDSWEAQSKKGKKHCVDPVSASCCRHKVSHAWQLPTIGNCRWGCYRHAPDFLWHCNTRQGVPVD